MKTSLGLDENIEGLLCYVLGWITGIIFLLIEKDSKFVKFHAMQSLITFLSLSILAYILGYISGALAWLVNILSFILWILGMYKAYKGEMYKFPIFGDIAEKQLK
ncbi:DUF4870 domain-containing protein [Methanothermococcus okinawensis]|uniref:Chloroplast import component protein (Tic20) n=1 Tax=Methanothermococcus okinawensis (strain DSM 14208 / JCM 11175 / IH1) TaxID=647113 RepID=F8AN32_METOI|nr:DUF4870 domain-containing protein [Methanothermococcus okinawensis]AEH06946.1 hypothetical protein Metok_0976 [Methanothermococcus okinawensis IH1]